MENDDVERRKKMMMLRRMTLWRKTDPKTGTPTLREPAQSKRMSRFHKRNFYTEIHSQNAAPQNRGADLLRGWAVETHAKISQEPLYT